MLTGEEEDRVVERMPPATSPGELRVADVDQHVSSLLARGSQARDEFVGPDLDLCAVASSYRHGQVAVGRSGVSPAVQGAEVLADDGDGVVAQGAAEVGGDGGDERAREDFERRQHDVRPVRSSVLRSPVIDQHHRQRCRPMRFRREMNVQGAGGRDVGGIEEEALRVE
eukprot:762957-Hanusia_phi.AAC.2